MDKDIKISNYEMIVAEQQMSKKVDYLKNNEFKSKKEDIENAKKKLNQRTKVMISMICEFRKKYSEVIKKIENSLDNIKSINELNEINTKNLNFIDNEFLKQFENLLNSSNQLLNDKNLKIHRNKLEKINNPIIYNNANLNESSKSDLNDLSINDLNDGNIWYLFYKYSNQIIFSNIKDICLTNEKIYAIFSNNFFCIFDIKTNELIYINDIKNNSNLNEIKNIYYIYDNIFILTDIGDLYLLKSDNINDIKLIINNIGIVGGNSNFCILTRNEKLYILNQKNHELNEQINDIGPIISINSFENYVIVFGTNGIKEYGTNISLNIRTIQIKPIPDKVSINCDKIIYLYSKKNLWFFFDNMYMERIFIGSEYKRLIHTELFGKTLNQFELIKDQLYCNNELLSNRKFDSIKLIKNICLCKLIK